VLVAVHEFAPGWVAAAAVILVMGACIAMMQSVFGGVVQRDASAQHRGRILSWYQGFNGMAYGLGLLTLGYTSDRFGLRPTFAVSGLLTAALLLAVRRTTAWADALDGHLPAQVETMPAVAPRTIPGLSVVAGS